ncbi:hypothetical protein JYA63_07260 [Fictibacillus nanhaiensis]|uniref:Thymidylate kinase n=1 Tax=Fictibacillus nanhaiensis TaxID=742169 RepID=A0ABS2ZPW0_9BACL|nr:hypothetical protein [Fictibacillus nanhaiensis]
MEKGILIAFEGISACGKSTQINYISKYLNDNEYKFTKTSWNSDEVISPLIGQAKKNKLFTPITWSILHATDFSRRYFEEILPALEENRVVLADRYYPTAYTRDTYRGIPANYVQNLYSFARKPDIIFFLDLPPEKSIERRLKRHPNLYYYSSGNDVNPLLGLQPSFMKYQNNLYSNYRELKEVCNFSWIDATQEPDKIYQDILLELEPLLSRCVKQG